MLNNYSVFPWPIYSQSTALFPRSKQIVKVCLETQQLYTQIFKKLASRKIIKMISSIRLILQYFNLKSDFTTVKYLNQKLTFLV
jgi:hypothetical protein